MAEFDYSKYLELMEPIDGLGKMTAEVKEDNKDEITITQKILNDAKDIFWNIGNKTPEELKEYSEADLFRWSGEIDNSLCALNAAISKLTSKQQLIRQALKKKWNKRNVTKNNQ